MYVAFEGPDGVGKTTLIRMLMDDKEMRSIPLIPVREPLVTPPADATTLLYAQSDELEKFFQNSRIELYRFLNVAPASYCILSDRSYLSSLVYGDQNNGLKKYIISQLAKFSFFNNAMIIYVNRPNTLELTVTDYAECHARYQQLTNNFTYNSPAEGVVLDVHKIDADADITNTYLQVKKLIRERYRGTVRAR